MHWYTSVLKKYAVFSGRARRKEYWMFALFNILIAIAVGILQGILSAMTGGDQAILSTIYSLAVLVPSIAVGVRRLHDTGRTGWWLLIGFIPLIGALVLLFFFVQDSQPGANEYGPNPKGLKV
ncbi:MAG: DUF805 domain-containing protein [Elainellaceae cyanobacterium]